MCLVDQLPCGSVLTPAISCTKFKIHSAHADSLGGPTPLWVSTYTLRPKQVFCLFFREDQSLLHRSRNSGREYVDVQTPLWVTTYTSYVGSSRSCTKFKIHLAHADSPMSKTGFSVYFLGRTSLCFIDQETQEENMLMYKQSSRFIQRMQTVPWPKPLWVSTSTSYLLYKVQDPFSAYRQSHVQNRFFCLFFREDQSLLHRPRNSVISCTKSI